MFDGRAERAAACFGSAVLFSLSRVGFPATFDIERIMLRIFDRYIGRQVFTATLIAVTVLSVVMVLGNIFKRLLSLPTEVLRDMPTDFLLKFVGYALLASLPMTIPWSLLTAVLLVFGRMSADNELLAIRMSGRSLFRICVPIFVLALTAMALCFWINLQIAPLANAEIKRLPALVATQNPKALLAADRMIDQLDDFIVYVGEREGDELRRFQMIQMGEKRFPTGFLNAERVLVSETPDGRGLNLEMFNATEILRDAEPPPDASEKEQYGRGPRQVAHIRPPIEAGHYTKNISIAALFEKLERVSPSMMSTPELAGKLGEQNAAAKKEPEPGAGKKKREGDSAREQASMLRTELNKRFSLSLACFVFALVGIPLGVTAQRRETSIGFALSLVIGVIYMGLMILGDGIFKGKPSALPHLLVWLPNVIFLSLGGFLFWRLSRR